MGVLCRDSDLWDKKKPPCNKRRKCVLFFFFFLHVLLEVFFSWQEYCVTVVIQIVPEQILTLV
jgi:hypothetical protein